MSRIFFLEATIFRLHIDERIVGDADGDTNFTVKIDLLDAPTLAIHRDETLKDPEPCDNKCLKNLDYYAGRACHFTATRRDIVNFLKRKPLKIGIYRGNERFPVCHGVVPFSGCVCDLVSKAIEEPKPFEFRGSFNLIDPGGNPSGHINLGIVLEDLGKHIIVSYALDRDSFILKNRLEGAEYKCGSLKNLPDKEKENSIPLTIDDCRYVDDDRENFMRDVIGICLGASGLSRGKPVAKVARQPLEDAEAENANNLKASKAKSTKSEKKSKKKKKK